MPCGGGDVGLNVWVENGELYVYMARSGGFDENNALLKEGRLHVTISPSVFDGSRFTQELHLNEGYVTVSGEKNGVKTSVKIWVDVFAPVIHLDINSNKKTMVTAAYESWRYQDRILQPRENFGNSWKWAAHENTICKRDSIAFNDNGVLFYHHNTSPTIFDATVEQQGMESVKDSLYDPLKDLCFGGLFTGKNFRPDGVYEGVYVNTDFKAWKLKSTKAATKQSLQIFLNTQQTNDDRVWKRSVDSLQKANADNDVAAFNKTQQWWQQFWNRSFIFINADTGSVDW
jgi:hypothetical protein